MTNDITGIHSARTGQAGNRNTKRVGNESDAPARAGDRANTGDDKVSLTSTAARLKDIERRLATDQPPFDAERVNRTKQAIANGKYHVDAGRVADKMLKFEKPFDK